MIGEVSLLSWDSQRAIDIENKEHLEYSKALVKSYIGFLKILLT